MANNEQLEKTSGSLFDSAWNETQPSNLTGLDDSGLASKRLSTMAIASTVVALLSLLAFIGTGFSVLSVLAIIMATAAFYFIGKSGGELVGLKFACVGLALGLVTLIGGQVRKITYRVAFERQAEEFCQAWFQAVKDGDITQVRQMTAPYWKRATIMSHKDEVDMFVRQMAGDEEPHSDVHAFLANPTLLTLSALRDRIHPTFYGATAVWLTPSTESTERIYAITVDPAGPNEKKQTFFMRLVCNRNYNKTEEGEKLVGWSTTNSDLSVMELDKDGRPVWKQEDM